MRGKERKGKESMSGPHRCEDESLLFHDCVSVCVIEFLLLRLSVSNLFINLHSFFHLFD